jgi:hypothetical protein
MRYRRGHVSLSDEKDIPLLITIRNARAITYDQICAIAIQDDLAGSRRVVHWRVSRLEQAGLVRRCMHELIFHHPIFSITQLGLQVLESRGYALVSLPSNTKEIVRKTQVLHSVELVDIRIALASKGLLKTWRWELEIVSTNLVYGDESTKDYDALAEIRVGSSIQRIAIEFERTLKGSARYETLRKVFNAENGVDTILYLTPSSEILYLLAVELRDVRKKLSFALSKTFQAELLDADVLSNLAGGGLMSFREFLLS